MAMPDGFGHHNLPDGSIMATFHAISVQSHQSDHVVLPEGIPFTIVRGGQSIQDAPDDSTHVFGGFLLMSPERIDRLGGLKCGTGWTALKVKPQIIEGTSPILCSINMHDEESGSIIRHAMGSDNAILVDVCAGIGGWHYGGRPFNLRPAISIEIDEEVANVMCYNHHLQKFSPARFSSATKSELNVWVQTGILVNGDFTDDSFWETLGHRGIKAFFASLPCPPWSRLTGANGLSDARGKLFQSFAFMMNVFRPVLIALENLPGLVSHPDWGCILKSFEDVGFVLSHESVDSLTQVLPMSRDRLSLIFVNKTHASELTTLKLRSFPLPTMVYDPNPRKLGVYHEEEPVQVMIATCIKPAQEELLTDRSMWPKNWKLTRPLIDNRVQIEDRLISQNAVMPCVVAKYAQPESISTRLLVEKGLVMKITQSPLGPRWFSPIEIQAALGFPMAFMHTRNDNLAYHVLGNSISPAHAAATIARAIALYPELCPNPVRLTDALGKILAQVPRYPFYSVDWDEQFYWTIPKTSVTRPLHDFTGNIPELHSSLKRPLPDEGTDPGLLSVSPAAPPQNAVQSTSHQCTSFEQVLQCVDEDATMTVFKLIAPSLYIQEFACNPGCNFWISGFSSRGCSQVPDWNFKIVDSQDSWTSHVFVKGNPTVGEVIQVAIPCARPVMCETLTVGGIELDWDTAMPHAGTLLIEFRKALRVIHVAGTPLVFNLFCDPIDTVRMICNDHPMLSQVQGSPEAVGIDCRIQSKSLDLLRLGSSDPMLSLDCPCWVMKFTDQSVAQTTSVVKAEVLSVYDSESDTEPSSPCRTCKVAVIHPFTGRFHEVTTQPLTTIAQLLEEIEPVVSTNVQIIAEVNCKRVGLHDVVSSFPSDCTFRFRHFSAKGGTPVVASLKTELVARGVPPEQAGQRASAVMSTIGEEKVHGAFLTTDPWAVLKKSCSEKQVRLIHPTELKNHQQTKRDQTRSASSKPRENPSSKGKGASKGKGKHQQPNTPLPCWDEIAFPNGFVDGNDKALKVLNKSQVLPDAHGICPVSLSEAQAFMNSTGNTLSDDTLALLVIGHVLEASDLISHVAIPTTILKTNEPVLLPATLIQLSANPASFTFSGPTAAVDTVPSTVIEVLIEANRCSFWDAVAKPLDMLVQCIPTLRSRENLLSHWSWKFTDGKRHVVSPSNAVTLHGYIRIPEAILDVVLRASGPCGVSMWPKSPDRQNDPRFSHIPVGAQTFEEAAAIAQSTQHGVGFVHHNQKWLVRCRREHYPEVRQTLVPQGFVLETTCIGTSDKLFVLQAPNSDLSCTPKAINVGLEGIGWKASVVKSVGPSAWLVASTCEPPSQHVSLNQQIMSIRPYNTAKPPTQFAVAVPSQGQGAVHNAWSCYVPTTSLARNDPNGRPNPGPTASRFEELEKAMAKKLEGLIDDKVAALEGKIGTIEKQTQQQAAECTSRLDTIENQMVTNTSSIGQLDQRIQANHEQMLAQMREMFKTFQPCEENKRRKSEPNAPANGA